MRMTSKERSQAHAAIWPGQIAAATRRQSTLQSEALPDQVTLAINADGRSDWLSN
jgi:hypothetical protein